MIKQNLLVAEPEGHTLRLDLYVPADAPKPVRPLILVHGERSEAKTSEACLATDLAQNRFAAAVIEYRTPLERTYPAALDDVLAAVRWLRTNGESIGLDVGAVGLVGRDFGGYIATLAGLTAPDEIQAVAAIHAPMDLTRYIPSSGYPYRSHVFLGFPQPQRPDLWEKASPLHRARRNTPPLLLLQGDSDEHVPLEQATAMRDAVDAVGAYVRLVTIEGVGNGFFDIGAGRQRAVEELSRFFDRFLWAPPQDVEFRLISSTRVREGGIYTLISSSPEGARSQFAP